MRPFKRGEGKLKGKRTRGSKELKGNISSRSLQPANFTLVEEKTN